MADVRYQFRGVPLEPMQSPFAAYLSAWDARRIPLIQARMARDPALVDAKTVDDMLKAIDADRAALVGKEVWATGTGAQSAIALERAQIGLQAAVVKAQGEEAVAITNGNMALKKQAQDEKFQRQNSKIVTPEDSASVRNAGKDGMALLHPASTPDEVANAMGQIAGQVADALAADKNPTHQAALLDEIETQMALKADYANLSPDAKRAFDAAFIEKFCVTYGVKAIQSTDASEPPAVVLGDDYDRIIDENAKQNGAFWTGGPGPTVLKKVHGGGVQATTVDVSGAAASAPPGATPAAGVAPTAPAGAAPSPGGTASSPAPSPGAAAVPTTVPGVETSAGLGVPDPMVAVTTGFPDTRSAIGDLNRQEAKFEGLLPGGAQTPEDVARQRARATVELDPWTRAPDPNEQAQFEAMVRRFAQDPAAAEHFQKLAEQVQMDRTPDKGEVTPRYVAKAEEALTGAPGTMNVTGDTDETTQTWSAKWHDFLDAEKQAGNLKQTADGAIQWTDQAKADAKKLTDQMAVAAANLSPAQQEEVLGAMPVPDDLKTMIREGSATLREAEADAHRSAMRDYALARDAIPYSAAGAAEAAGKADAEHEIVDAITTSRPDEVAARLAKRANEARQGPHGDSDRAKAEAARLTDAAAEMSARTWTPEERAAQRANAGIAVPGPDTAGTALPYAGAPTTPPRAKATLPTATAAAPSVGEDAVAPGRVNVTGVADVQPVAPTPPKAAPLPGEAEVASDASNLDSEEADTRKRLTDRATAKGLAGPAAAQFVNDGMIRWYAARKSAVEDAGAASP